MTAEASTYILLGSNLGDRHLNLSVARDHLTEALGTIERESRVYQSMAWGNHDQPDFLNQVILVYTSLDPYALLKQLLAIEEVMGRKRMEKWGPRLVDLDLLFYGNSVINQKDLTVPHPGIHLRRFTLVPLVEIAPAYIHPVLNKSMAELLADCPDPLEVKPLPTNS